ncbi:MAG: T9SS type A sorting domain-containing protein [Cyclobacteriaceae bacterium]|nr:T9SS type A sorting domain-containing protein [Cyclobacteriaceae bacterium HetDA_MAG_MS6]
MTYFIQRLWMLRNNRPYLLFLKALLCFFLLLGLLGQEAYAQGTIPYGEAGQQTAVPKNTPNGLNYGFFEYLPLDYDSNDTQRKYPLILFFHGRGEQGDGSAVRPQNESQPGLGKLLYHNGNERKADPPSLIANESKHYQAIVLSVQQANAFVPALITKRVYDWVKANYPIDITRVYLTGLSAGGVASFNLLAAHPEIPAAVLVHETAGKVAFPDKEASGKVPLWAHYNSRGSFGRSHQKTIDSLANLGGSTSFLDGYPKPYVSGRHFTRQLVNGEYWGAFEEGIITPSETLNVTIYGRNNHSGWGAMYRSEQIFNWLYDQQKIVDTIPQIEISVDNRIDVTLPAASVHVSASATSSDGSPIVSYNWSLPIASPLTLVNSDSSTVTIESLVEGNFTLTVEATNMDGIVGSSEVLLVIEDQPIPLVADAGPDQQISERFTSLDGSLSQGEITTYSWKYLDGLQTFSAPIHINFTTTAGNGTASAPWNNYTAGLTVGSKIENLVDGSGRTTAISMELVDAWQNSNPYGTTGGIYPNEVSKYFYYFNRDGQSRDIRVEGLLDDQTYNLTMFNGAAFGSPGQYTTIFASQGDTATLDPRWNTSNVAILDDLTPQQGAISLNVSTEAAAASISALIITPNDTSQNLPIIESPDAVVTHVSMLQPGTYQFELTITNLNGDVARDTVAITVIDQVVPFASSRDEVENISTEGLKVVKPSYEQLEDKVARGLTAIQVYSLSGKPVKYIKIGDHQTIHLESLREGFYIVRFDYEDGGMERQKMFLVR